MRKFINVYKRTIAVFAIVLMSINTYATTASNDGSSFITKAEFDSAMDGFNGKIEEYQSSLNAKIDDAIAGYIAGMSSERSIDLDNYLMRASESDIRNCQFIMWQTPNATKDVKDVNGGYMVGRVYGVGIANNEADGGFYNYDSLNNTTAWSGNYGSVRYTDYTDVADDFNSAYYYAQFPYKSSNDTTTWVLNNIKRKRLHIDLYASKINYNYGTLKKDYKDLTPSPPSEIITDYTQLSMPGSFHHSSQGTFAMLQSNINPMCVQVHAWSDFNETEDKNKNDFLYYNLSGTISGSDKCVEYDRRDYYDGDAVVTEIQKTKPQGTYKDGVGSKSGASVGAIARTLALRAWYWTESSGYNNNVSFKFKYKTPKIYTLNWTNLTNSFFNTVLGKPVYKYQGIPFTNVKKEGTIEFKLILDNADPGAYTYCIADAPFGNEAIPEHMYETVGGKQYDHVLKRGAVSRSGAEVIEVSIPKDKIFDTKNGDTLYIKVDPSVAGEKVTVSITNLKEKFG